MLLWQPAIDVNKREDLRADLKANLNRQVKLSLIKVGHRLLMNIAHKYESLILFRRLVYSY